MARGGAANKKYSNKLMVMRVVLQAVAIIAIYLLAQAKPDQKPSAQGTSDRSLEQ